jgi:hypothetical protein
VLVVVGEVDGSELMVDNRKTPKGVFHQSSPGAINPAGQLLRKEKDEASPSRLCGRDSLNAFIPRFAGL